MNVLIAEDETPAAKRLIRLLAELRPEWRVNHHFDSVEEVVNHFFSGNTPDIAFFDIQLADGLSFEIFDRSSVNCPVIFITAYDHYAVKAFRVNSIDYLLKPIDPDQLADALEKFDQRTRISSETPDIKALLSGISRDDRVYRKRFLVKTAGRLAFIPVQDIAYAFSDDGSAFIVTRKNDRYLVESTLEEMEGELSPDQFFRISRGMIVSMDAIDRIEPHFSSRLILQLNPAFDNDVFVSRQRAAEFKSWLDQ
jgi:DNA-binding LytR/AlgR family response regulator